jgi:hypothetical protein
MTGVGVIMLGVREGMTVQAGNVCWGIFTVSQAPRKNTRTGRMNIFFIK